MALVVESSVCARTNQSGRLARPFKALVPGSSPGPTQTSQNGFYLTQTLFKPWPKEALSRITNQMVKDRVLNFLIRLAVAISNSRLFVTPSPRAYLHRGGQ